MTVMDVIYVKYECRETTPGTPIRSRRYDSRQGIGRVESGTETDSDAGTLAEERKLFPAKADGAGRLCQEYKVEQSLPSEQSPLPYQVRDKLQRLLILLGSGMTC